MQYVVVITGASSGIGPATAARRRAASLDRPGRELHTRGAAEPGRGSLGRFGLTGAMLVAAWHRRRTA